MAGRAGRRGIDTIGHVVHCNNLFPLPSKQDYSQIMQGKPQTLVSKFRISFNLILSLIKNNKVKFIKFAVAMIFKLRFKLNSFMRPA